MSYLDLKSNKERLIIDFSKLGFRNVAVLGHYMYRQAKKELDMHQHIDMIEICYLETGQQFYKVENTDYLLKGGDIIVNPPNTIHGSSGFPEEKGSLFWLIIKIPKNGEGLLNLNSEESKLLINSLLSFQDIHFRGTSEMKKNLYNIFKSYNKTGDKLSKIEITSLILNFLLQVIRCGEMRNKNNISDDIEYCCKYIEENIFQRIYINKLAEKIHLSESRFKHKFKRETGTPPNQYILRKKIKKAKELIALGQDSMSDLAYDLGFSNSSYFSLVFRKYEGQTPSEFKMRLESN